MTLNHAENRLLLLLRWAGKDSYYLMGSVLCALISSLAAIIPYWGLYRIIEALYQGAGTSPEVLLDTALIIAVSLFIRYGAFSLAVVLSHKGAYNTLFRVRCMVTEKMATLPLGRLDERGTGEVKSLLNETIEKLELFLAHHLPELVLYLTGPVVIFIYLFSINNLLALVSLLPLVCALMLMAVMFYRSREMMAQANIAVPEMNAAIIEYINGMRVIKALDMSGRSFVKFTSAINKTHQLWVRMSKKLAPLYASYVVVLECGMIFIIPLGGVMFVNGDISASGFILFTFVGSLYLTEIRPLQEMGTNLAWVMNSVTKVDEVLNIPSYGGSEPFPEHTDIAFREVTFGYTKERNILSHCNLEIAQGEKIAFVGPSGAGKTTAVVLASRFYDVDQGGIYIGGVNVKNIDYEQLLNNISIVFQKSFLTRGSILENIRMNSDATLEQVRTAASKAQIDNFIQTLPEGYHTLVGSYGSRLSGGQQQRIAIARAILKDAPILILDEATSAADPENQLQIDRAITNLCEGKTVIAIAHRLGIVEQYDRLVVVNHGTFDYVGAHQHALGENAYYSKVWRDYTAARTIQYGVEKEAKCEP